MNLRLASQEPDWGFICATICSLANQLFQVTSMSIISNLSERVSAAKQQLVIDRVS